MARLDVHAQLSRALAALTDAQLVAALADATPLGAGIGGPVATMEIAGAPVFVKTVRLTDLERAPAHVRSTANLFGLPLCYQYGLSSAGFGAWRELAAHLLATDWVTTGACAGFPLLHHWRILPRTPTPTTSPDLERQVAGWGGSPAIRARLTAMAQATASVVLVLERFRHDLRTWLGVSRAGPTSPARTTRAVPAWLEPELLAVTEFLAARGFVHFDAHFQNLLTDGEHVYLSDFGQALSATFALDADEADFLTRHRDFDRSYVVARLFALTGDPRHAAIAALLDGFFATLRADLTARFPTDALAAAWATYPSTDGSSSRCSSR